MVEHVEEVDFNSPITKFTHCLTGYPLLMEIWQNLYNMTMYKKKGETSSRPMVSLYMGHDRSIEPLLTILQIKRDLWLLPLASAITFELYSLRSKKFYIRVIYNGNDVTKQLIFCRKLNGDGLCDFENFNFFAMKDIDHHCFFGDNFSNACNSKR
ncbi:hypothetical protein HELRODRAFT_182836 [Helobdella robusta]|uniref:2-phosphoxylose phosphatase 1 n=1 Tax=Helobdella robusta TaxID=6412 RepID=T1FIU3_HELRO|nr:hypothetical protein HELRODRAFT_182836 [Helobdella robusta]ESN90046.1 hypothetical protein HELRODRAFT_182836 [Helobdella robusta]